MFIWVVIRIWRIRVVLFAHILRMLFFAIDALFLIGQDFIVFIIEGRSIKIIGIFRLALKINGISKASCHMRLKKREGTLQKL